MVGSRCLLPQRPNSPQASLMRCSRAPLRAHDIVREIAEYLGTEKMTSWDSSCRARAQARARARALGRNLAPRPSPQRSSTLVGFSHSRPGHRHRLIARSSSESSRCSQRGEEVGLGLGLGLGLDLGQLNRSRPLCRGTRRAGANDLPVRAGLGAKNALSALRLNEAGSAQWIFWPVWLFIGGARS
jgi:hypothetical protein